MIALFYFVGSENPCIYSVPNRKQSYDVDVASEHDIPLIVKRIVEAGGDLYHVSEQQMSLEEIYFSLIDREHAEMERENT